VPSFQPPFFLGQLFARPSSSPRRLSACLPFFSRGRRLTSPSRRHPSVYSCRLPGNMFTSALRSNVRGATLTVQKTPLSSTVAQSSYLQRRCLWSPWANPLKYFIQVTLKEDAWMTVFNLNIFFSNHSIFIGIYTFYLSEPHCKQVSEFNQNPFTVSLSRSPFGQITWNRSQLLLSWKIVNRFPT
jgi:hypothetical protein